MIISSKFDFITEIKQFEIDTEYAIIKPNWVSNRQGEFTEAEILDWLLTALPDQKKIVIESYTPWRGERNEELLERGAGLEDGKAWRDQYQQRDTEFLASTGIGAVLDRHQAEYLNVTDAVWDEQCVEAVVVQQLVESAGRSVTNPELYGFVPRRLFDLRDRATLISLGKIKVEESIPTIIVSMSVKNLFGLIPHPSRRHPYQGTKHERIPATIRDVYTIYTSVFSHSLWIAEGIKSWVKNYCQPDQLIIKDKYLLFVGTDGTAVDTEACRAVGINPKNVPYLSRSK